MKLKFKICFSAGVQQIRSGGPEPGRQSCGESTVQRSLDGERADGPSRNAKDQADQEAANQIIFQHNDTYRPAQKE